MRKIIHIDMDCFYAAVEVRDNPKLKGRPVAVGGSSEGRGVISAANYEARKFGVHSALSTALALRKCPHLQLVYPNMKKYVAESKKIHAIFKKFTDVVEPLSLDEAYLDVSNSSFFKGSASLIASEIRRQIYESTGLTASAGIAPNKFLAKVASDWNKPNGQFVITPGMVDSFVKELPVEKLWGVGKVTSQKMHQKGIRFCGELQKFSKEEMETLFGSFGRALYDMCRGIDNRKVTPFRERKSVSIERTFQKDLATLQECQSILPELYEIFLNRFKEKKRKIENIKTLFVKVKFSNFTSTTAEGSFDSINIKHFQRLLETGFERQSLPVRLIGLGVRLRSKPKEDESQLFLFKD